MMPVTSRKLTRWCILLAGSEEDELVAAAAHQQQVAVAISLLSQQSGMGPSGPNRKPSGFCWRAHVHRLTESEFKLRYRVSYDSFNTLLDKLASRLRVTNVAQAVNSRSHLPICLEVRLAVALRYFAGGDAQDLALIYDISKGCVWRLVWLVVDAVNLTLDNMRFEDAIDDPDALQALEMDFAMATRGGFWRGQVGAIDGVHIKMRRPSQTDVNDPNRYHVARKDIYALLLMAIADIHRRFTWADCSMAPQTHDSTAWTATELGQRVERGDLPYPYFLNGDAAFSLGPSMITPSNNDPALDDLDYYQSSNRMPIECAFGILIRRWGVLWRPLTQRFNRRAKLVIALMRLHNFCIDERLAAAQAEEELPDVLQPYPEMQPGRGGIPPKFDKDLRPVEALQTCCAADEGAPTRAQQAQSGVKAARRDELNRAMKAAGYVRVLRGGDKQVRIQKKPKGKAKTAKGKRVSV
jgi:hypothetical protein